MLTLVHPCDIYIGMTTSTKADRKEAELIPSVTERQALKAQIDDLTKRLATLDSEIIANLQALELTSITTPLGKVNLIQNNTLVWNEELLQSVLSGAQWNRVTVRKVDKTLLEAEITVGRIKAEDVEVAKTIKQSKPFLR